YIDDVAVRRAADLLVGRRVAEAHRIFLRVGEAINPAGMHLRRIGAREQRGHGERLAGVHRSEHDAHLGAAREFGRAIHRLGWIALRIAGDELDLAAVNAAGLVDLFDRELGAAVDTDARG